MRVLGLAIALALALGPPTQSDFGSSLHAEHRRSPTRSHRHNDRGTREQLLVSRPWAEGSIRNRLNSLSSVSKPAFGARIVPLHLTIREPCFGTRAMS